MVSYYIVVPYIQSYFVLPSIASLFPYFFKKSVEEKSAEIVESASNAAASAANAVSRIPTDISRLVEQVTSRSAASNAIISSVDQVSSSSTGASSVLPSIDNISSSTSINVIEEVCSNNVLRSLGGTSEEVLSTIISVNVRPPICKPGIFTAPDLSANVVDVAYAEKNAENLTRHLEWFNAKFPKPGLTKLVEKLPDLFDVDVPGGL